jgi:Ku70/Ku80 beta-barrel domain
LNQLAIRAVNAEIGKEKAVERDHVRTVRRIGPKEILLVSLDGQVGDADLRKTEPFPSACFKIRSHRIKYMKVDADTGEEVSNDDITKGYKVDTDTYIEVSKDELENIALESTRTIDIDEFVPKSSIDPRLPHPPVLPGPRR